MARNNHSLWDRTWKDAQGNYTIWQMPNAPLIAWAVLTTISLFVSGAGSDVFSLLGEASLIVWALLEIFKGDSYYRRVLGTVVLVVAVVTVVKNF